VLVPTVTDMINEELLTHPDCKLRMIANFGNGVDNIDVEAAHAHGITVTNTPKVLTEDTADMTMALILAVPRRLIQGASVLTDGKNWAGWSPTWMLGHRIGGKRLGIIGMGRIGQAVARRARAFGLQIHYHNRRPVAPRIADELGATYWESLDQMLARMDIISVNCPHTPATYHLLSARRLKLIANFGNGVDNIDVVTAVQRGITVTNTPGVLTEDTADMTMALILAVPRRLAEGAQVLTSDSAWTGWSPTWMLGHRIWGKRLGIVGMGRIGQAVARRAKAFGLQIHYHNRRKLGRKIEEALDATYWESLDQMLARMDIVSVNCPHTPATYHLMSERREKSLRAEDYIVNTSRGELIDENALARLIEAGDIAGAGLDVFEHEPAVNPILVKLARDGKVVLLPHMGSATLEGRVDMGEKVIVNIRTFMDGHKPPDRVLPSML
jgi:glyoxylate reductase